MPNAARDTDVHGPSGDPDALLGGIPDGPILMPETIAQAESDNLPFGIRLSHMNNNRHDILNPDGTHWYSFHDHVLIVDTEEEAQWLEDLIGTDVIKRDDLPQPIECLVCKAQGKMFTTKCLPFYARHMYLAHSG